MTITNYLAPLPDGLPMRDAGAWAAVKLDYLQRYIDIFATAMSRKWDYLNYIDLMAGPGKNIIKTSKEVLLGSPLRALMTKQPFTNFYFVEKSAQDAETLRLRIASSPYATRCRILTGDCNELVSTIVADLLKTERSALNLAFLDPEGIELHWTTVAQLASVRRMDLIINYSEGGLNRLMRKAYRSQQESGLDLFFGTPKWRQLFDDVERGRVQPFALRRNLIDLYRDNLRTLGYRDVVRGDEVLQTEPLMRNTRRAPLYRLLFASKHDRGNEFWQKVTRHDVYGQRPLFE
jgi:three-Cys-motif partner protein